VRSKEFKVKTEKAVVEHKEYLLERLKLNEVKEKIRKEHVTVKKKEVKDVSDKTSDYLRLKLEKSKQKTEQRIQELKEEIEQKEKYKEIRKKHLDIQKNQEAEQFKKLGNRRAGDTIKKEYENERKRSISPSSSSNSVDNSISQIPVNKLSKSHNANQIKGIQSKTKFGENEYINGMLQKFELMEKRVQDRKMKKLKDNMLFSELNMLKEEGFRYNHNKQINIHEYLREKNLQVILARQMKAEEKKNEKQLMKFQKRVFEDEMKLKKKSMIENLQKAARNPSSFSPDRLKSLFPEDNELIEKFNFLKEAEDSGNRKIVQVAESVNAREYF